MFCSPHVGLAGDWHGNTDWAVMCLDLFKDQDISTIYHLGDFGVWPWGDSYRTTLNDILISNNQ